MWDQPLDNMSEFLNSTGGWLANAVSETYQAAGAVLHTGLTVAEGAVEQVVEHPLQVAADVALGAGAVLATEALGLGTVAVAAAAAVPLVGYGIYKGLEIASTEGISAIPKHFLDSCVSTLNTVAQTVGAELYPGEHTQSEKEQADANLRAVGAGGVSLAAFSLGGPVKVAGANILRSAVELAGKGSTDLIEALGVRSGYGGLHTAFASATDTRSLSGVWGRQAGFVKPGSLSSLLECRLERGLPEYAGAIRKLKQEAGHYLQSGLDRGSRLPVERSLSSRLDGLTGAISGFRGCLGRSLGTWSNVLKNTVADLGKRPFSIEPGVVSPQIQRRIYQAASSLPPEVLRVLRGTEVVVSDRVSNVLPHLRGVCPRGWSTGSTWDDATGMFYTDRFGRPSVIMAEKSGENGIGGSYRVEGVVRHEVGHAFDRNYGIRMYGNVLSKMKNVCVQAFSDSPDFVRAYNNDLMSISRLPHRQQNNLAYFLQPGSAGRQESFAEIFAIINGGGAAPDLHSQMVESFPATIQTVWGGLRGI